MRFGKLLRLLVLAGLLALPWASVPGVTMAGPASAEDIPDDWWAQVQEDIRQSEYHITWQEHSALPDLAAAYQAPNRAQNLRFYFTEDGIRVIPRTGDVAWELGLGVRDAGPAELVAQAQRIAYQRADFVETFTNTEAGLQHAVALDGNAAFDLTLGGNLIPRIAADGQSVEFRTASGVPVLRYGDFSAGQNVSVQISQPDATHLRFTFHVSRFTFHASRFTHHVPRPPHCAPQRRQLVRRRQPGRRATRLFRGRRRRRQRRRLQRRARRRTHLRWRRRQRRPRLRLLRRRRRAQRQRCLDPRD